ncbi:MAG: hypothetical protein EON50_16900 [Acidovorax sp.]|nr:MAG: hypothetical protein EON50_16900 [Acidovorax sp.]
MPANPFAIKYVAYNAYGISAGACFYSKINRPRIPLPRAALLGDENLLQPRANYFDGRARRNCLPSAADPAACLPVLLPTLFTL